MSEELTPVTLPHSNVEYFEFSCSKCGEKARNTYTEPYRTNMLNRRLCWNCNYWVDEEEKLKRDYSRMTIIGGRIYGPGSKTSGNFRGMAGRRFDIEYTEPSIFAGKRITTLDLWAGSTIPDDMREKYPDTAKFLNGAEQTHAGDTTCWNPSSCKGEMYPLPKTLIGLA